MVVGQAADGSSEVELAAAAPEDGFSPLRGMETFDRWLLADPAQLAQVLPEVKGVVALRPRSKAPERERWHTASSTRS